MLNTLMPHPARIGKNDHELPSAVRDSLSERPSNLDSLDEDERNILVSLETENTGEAKRGWGLDRLCCFRRKDQKFGELDKFDETGAV